MAPNSGYLTFSPSTSSSRSILEEPSKGSQEPLEQSQEPLEQSQEPSERSQEPLAQENGEWPQETIEQIVELKSKKAQWPEIGAAVGLTQNTCCQIWEEHQRRQERAKVTIPDTIPDTIPEPSRQGKRWSSDEYEMLLRLYKAGDMWDDMSAKLAERSGHACKVRFLQAAW